MNILRFGLSWAAGLALVVCFQGNGSLAIAQEDHPARGETGFPDIVGVDIPGAPKLAQPFMVMGATKPVMTEKHGLCGPALYDWDGDGKRDLMLGEFDTCTERGGGFPGGEENGSAIRVYLNVGSDNNPEFSDEFIYARDTEGNVIEVPQW